MGEFEATMASETTDDSELRSSSSPDSLVAILDHLHLDRTAEQQQSGALDGGIEAFDANSGDSNAGSNEDAGSDRNEGLETGEKVDAAVNGGIEAGEEDDVWGGGNSEGLRAGEKVEELDEVKSEDARVLEVEGVGEVGSADWGVEEKGDDDVRVWSMVEEVEERFNVLTEDLAYPVRPGKHDCSYYMKTGKCAYGSNCKFNHPPRTATSSQVTSVDRPEATAIGQEKGAEDFPGKGGQIECKYYLTPGGCKYGKSCKYEHIQEKIEAQPGRLNFLGLPIRTGVKDCPFYMRNGACKYSANCCFNHPDPTAMAGQNSFSGQLDGGSQQNSPMMPFPPPAPYVQPSSVISTSPLNSSEGTPTVNIPSYIPRMLFPSRAANLTSVPRDYQEPSSTLFSNVTNTEQTPYAPSDGTMSISDCSPSQQVQIDFPERPGQPECPFFMKTGNCKFRAQCKFHHPRSRLSKVSMCNISPHGLPLRPDQPICSSYSRFGICKYGPACKFDHPMDSNSSTTGVARSYREIVNARVLEMEG